MWTYEIADAVSRCVLGFTRTRVLVLGDAILDEYLLGDCSRISPEAPVPILKVGSSRQVLGGAANTAANVVALGGHATLIALVGNDDAGAALKQRASDAHVDLVPIDHGMPTLRKTRVVGQHQQIVRLDYEEYRTPDPSVESQVLALFDAHIASCDIVVVSDYAKGFVSPSICRAIIERAHAAGREVIVDPRPQNRACYDGCDYVTPNWKEACSLLHVPDGEPTDEETASIARSLAETMNTNVVLTLGAAGIRFCSRRATEQFAVPTLAREVFDVSGAGDTVVAAFALSRAVGTDHATAVEIANRAASVVVSKFGTATATADEVLRGSDASRLVPRDGLARLAAALRAQGKRIVTIIGTFDILHIGHLLILDEARQRGDVLIIGLDNDATVRIRKGPQRPLVSERQRAQVLLALRLVHYVHIVDEPDARTFLTEIRPHVHVDASPEGDNYAQSELVRRGGGRVDLIQRLPGVSTGQLVDGLEDSQSTAAG